jgi:hypothetical protein
MTGVLSLEALRVPPAREVVLGTQGIPQGHPAPKRVTDLADEAMALYESLTQPKGVVCGITPAEFREVYQGEGHNAVPAPLPEIAEKATGMALFAATLGEPVSKKINDLFRTNDSALGCMLDGIASERADTAATLLGQLFLESLLQNGKGEADTRVLPYSPGYCGWHITGQRNLFAVLDPERIGIALNDSCLMTPLKSVSGVLVAGPADIHDFENDFEFCLDCATWDCRERIAAII